jgi:hypothetical protein
MQVAKWKMTNCMEHQVMMSYKDMTMKCFGYVRKNIKIYKDENNIDVSKGKKCEAYLK